MTFTDEEQRRIELTTAVHDTDALPKVSNAGEIETRNGTQVQVMHNGLVVEKDGYFGPWITEIIRRLRGHHEPQEEAAFAAVVERLKQDTPKPVMVELGSYWAYYSLWLKTAIPDAQNVCVEPDPRNLEVGRRNFALNGAQARFIQAAVGSPHGRQVKLPVESDDELHPMRLVTLEGLMRDEGLERIDLLLSDVQGAETDLLTTGQDVLRSGRVRFLVVSTHHHSVSEDPLTHQRCRDLLESAGAHIITDHSVLESCSGDGLLVASTDPRDRDMRVEVTVVRNRDSIYGEPEYELARAPQLVLQRVRSAVGKRMRALLP
jgi:FkbM family methyltransferase